MRFGVIIIIILVLLLTLVGIILCIIHRIRRKVKEYSNLFLGTDSLTEGIRSIETEMAVTPKSVSSATSLYLPSIMKDFPEFHFDEMKARAENVLTSYLRCIDQRNPSLLTEGTNELREQLSMRLEMLKSQGKRERFEEIKIHRTEIAQYRKAKGRCSVVFQTAIQYFHYTERNGELESGCNDLTEQAKYNIEVVYIQDREMVENLGDAGLALNCPNCGGPLPGLGAKVCVYCDSPVIEFNLRTWNFNRVEMRS